VILEQSRPDSFFNAPTMPRTREFLGQIL